MKKTWKPSGLPHGQVGPNFFFSQPEICPLCLDILCEAREETFRDRLLNEIRNSGYQFEDFNVKPAVPNFTLLQDRATMYHLQDTIG